MSKQKLPKHITAHEDQSKSGFDFIALFDHKLKIRTFILMDDRGRNLRNWISDRDNWHDFDESELGKQIVF